MFKKTEFLGDDASYMVNPENPVGIIRPGRWKINVYEFSRLAIKIYFSARAFSRRSPFNDWLLLWIRIF